MFSILLISNSIHNSVVHVVLCHPRTTCNRNLWPHKYRNSIFTIISCRMGSTDCNNSMIGHEPRVLFSGSLAPESSTIQISISRHRTDSAGWNISMSINTRLTLRLVGHEPYFDGSLEPISSTFLLAISRHSNNK